MTYGKTTPTQYTDPEVQEVQIHTTRLGKVMPGPRGSHIVDRYPILRFVPLVAGTLRRWHEEELKLFERMVQGVREDVVSVIFIHNMAFVDGNLRCRRRTQRSLLS